ncbi:hypothetical protein [Fodinicurvata sediminis]|uniref:hypothetical protein n=1 Tax=Fodinicurvata sediminis TaxID=1121832 RepID=UPI0003B4762B|nr:hypothetical protein [Fodinicurvata sediminis]
MTAADLPLALEVASLRTATIAAQEAARRKQQVFLLSTPDAAAQGGSLWFIEIVRQTTADVPEAEVLMALDCGDAAGYTLEALHNGATGVVFRGLTPARHQLRQLSEQYGALFLTERPRSLFLDEEPDPVAACRTWFWFQE